MMKWIGTAGVILALGLMAQPAQAQVQFGAQANYADDFDLGVGVRAQTSIANFVEADSPLAPLTGVVSFDYYFPDCEECSYFEVNGNVQYPLDLGEGFAPYVGGGLHWGRFSVDYDIPGVEDVSDSEIGLNALGGLVFDLGGLDAFAEAKIELGGAEQFILSFGILFGD